jgi:NADH:ubiquinone oxidoreductase subunit E/NAD-dependent dihydropyrimidine dehydrogenase PreA subunit
MSETKVGSVLVVGGGIAGIQVATDLAKSGFYVYLVEKSPSIGGVMAQLDKTFPTNDCSMCILGPKLVGAGRHHNIKLITHADIEAIEGRAGDFTVKVTRHARSVDSEKCTGCGICTKECPVRFRIQIPEKPVEPPVIRDREQIDQIIAKYAYLPNSIIQVLLDVNEQYNYLPKDILTYLSFQMRIPMARIYRIITFYKAFSLTPKGKYHFKVCMGTACHVRGAEPLREAIEREIRGTPEGLFSLETVNCLGACAAGPVIVMNEEYHGNMDQQKVVDLIAELKQLQDKREIHQ